MRQALAVWLALVLGTSASAQDRVVERFELVGREDRGRRVRTTLVVSGGEPARVERQVIYADGRPGLALVGEGEWFGAYLTVRFQSGSAGDPVSAIYEREGSRLQGLLHDPLRRGGWGACAEGGARVRAPVEVERYAYAPADVASDRGERIDVAANNRAVSARLRGLDADDMLVPFHLIVVPGYASLDDRAAPRALHPIAQERLRLAAEAFRKSGAYAILVSGGNVHPPGTPFNEAVEMKRALQEQFGIPAARVAIDPYARHSTTNLRNAGRFMLAHGLSRALVVTTGPQSFYFSNPDLSGYHRRCERELGYRVGRLERVSGTRTRFVPAAKVTGRGEDPRDP